MAKKKHNGNGHGSGQDVAFALLAEINALRNSTEKHLTRMARLVSHMGDVLGDHERRLSALESK